MSDRQYIGRLIELGSSTASLDENEARAGEALAAFDGEHYPSDGCAITQSELFRSAGIEIPLTFQALAFVNMLRRRGWVEVKRGQQRPGDIGTTVYGGVPHHGIDHVYLVLKVMNPLENLIADNQARSPHFRRVDGRDGRSPTTMFLRAV